MLVLASSITTRFTDCTAADSPQMIDASFRSSARPVVVSSMFIRLRRFAQITRNKEGLGKPGSNGSNPRPMEQITFQTNGSVAVAVVRSKQLVLCHLDTKWKDCSSPCRRIRPVPFPLSGKIFSSLGRSRMDLFVLSYLNITACNGEGDLERLGTELALTGMAAMRNATGNS